jgi:hypothetical protein
MEYYIVSLKHTNKKDKYLTLWRPDNKGYCWMIASAGLYSEIQEGYHSDEGNKPIPYHELMRFVVDDDEGRPCIKNSKQSVQFILNYSIPEKV